MQAVGSCSDLRLRSSDGKIRFVAEVVGVEPTKPLSGFAVLQTAGLGHLPITSTMNAMGITPVDEKYYLGKVARRKNQGLGNDIAV